MEEAHKYFIQFMIRKSYRPINDCLDFLQHVQTDDADEVPDVAKLTGFIKEINKHIKRQQLEIVLMKCEVTAAQFLGLINLANDDISLLQVTYTQTELQYFDVLFQELLASDNHQLLSTVCINLSSSIKDLKVSRAETILDSWLEEGYFVRIDGKVHFGPKTIHEFISDFRNKYQESISNCILCNDLVLYGKSCESCESMVHIHCLAQYVGIGNLCLSCKSPWKEEDTGDSTN